MLTVNGLPIGGSPHAPAVWPASCAILTMTNSAGFSGAKATTMLTMPFCWSVDDVVVESHLTWNASLGVEPCNPPWLNSDSRNASIDDLIAVHSGSSFGSNTTQRRLASNVCSMNSVMRRTGTYIDC